MGLRALCLRCLRPRRVCYCARLPALPARTRVVFLQHLRERRMPIGTARMAHLSLPHSELHLGIDFQGHPRVEALAREQGTFILFPGEGARDVAELGPGELKTLVVVDGTWPLARKLIKVNPALQGLPRVAFTPDRPGNYRIRREPAAHCLSTIEAVAEVLGRLEGDRERFQQLLRPFDWMVDTQLALKAARRGPSRYVKLRARRKPPQETRVADELRALGERLVLLYAESNARPDGKGGRAHELIHLVAERPTTGARFEARLRPEGGLDETTPHHVELPARAFLEGEDRTAALGRWRAFLRPGDVVASWGYFSWDLVKDQTPDSAFLDLRERTMRVMRGRPPALETLARLGGAEASVEAGRATRRLSTLKWVANELLESRVTRVR